MSTSTDLKNFIIAKGTKAQITQAYSDGVIGDTDFAIATDEDLLDDKANKDLSNLSNGLSNTICTTPATTTSSASSAKPAVVIENYRNGKNWYRIYSDKWCEQGGESNGNYQTITLLKPFADTNYTLETLPLTDNTTTASAWNIGYFCGVRVSASQIKIGTTGSWFACGYIS